MRNDLEIWIQGEPYKPFLKIRRKNSYYIHNYIIKI